jgi:hypothetical protein
VVHSAWVLECIEFNAIIPFELRHVMYATPETNIIMLQEADRYGDSFTRNVSVGALKEVFNQVDIVGDFTPNNAYMMERELFGNDPPFFSLFTTCTFYFDPSAPLDLCKLLAKHYHGAISKKLTKSVTHVVMDQNFKQSYRPLQKKMDDLVPLDRGRRYLVSKEWVFSSVDKGELLVESDYLMKVILKQKKRERQVKLEQKKTEEIQRSATLSGSNSLAL